jgi:predicted transcriptional regulator
MNCQYSKYIDMLLDGSLNEKKTDELKKHSTQCMECSQRLNKIKQIDNLIKHELTTYPFNSSKSEIMEKVQLKQKKTLFRAGLYYSKKPIYALASIFIIVLLVTLNKPRISSLIFAIQSISDTKMDEFDLKFPINNEDIKSIYMPGEDYTINNERDWGPKLPLIMANDPKSEEAAKKILDEAAKKRAAYLNEWVAYINSYTKLRRSTQSEINLIGYKDRTPVTLSQKDGGYIHLYPMIEKTEVKETIQGKLTVKTPYLDRYIISYESQSGSSKSLKYYTVFSKSPLVQQTGATQKNIYQTFSINKIDSEGRISKEFEEGDLMKNGDRMIISGISAIGDSVDVYIKDGSDILNTPDPIKDGPSTEIYKIAHIDSIDGEWSLEKTISYSMKTYDGQQFNLGNKLYYSEIDYYNAEGRSAGGRMLVDLTK